MKLYVLILIVGWRSENIYTTSTEFTSEAKCIDAGIAAKKQSDTTGLFISYSCSEK